MTKDDIIRAAKEAKLCYGKRAQSPFASVWTSVLTFKEVEVFANLIAAHERKAPPVQPKREWVGLTDDEYRQIQRDYFRADQWRGIEAKLKEKNA